MGNLRGWLFPTQRLVDELAATIAYERERAREEIAWWRAQCEMYRGREERAVNRLLAVKVGVPGLDPERAMTPEYMQAQMAAAEQELTSQEEWARAGQV